MKSTQFLKEGFVEDASEVHADHEVQMARSDLFHAAEDALILHKLLRNVSEQQGLEGWVASKITLAADYLKTVREYLEYQLMTGDVRPEVAVQTTEMPIAEAEEDVAEGSMLKSVKRGMQGWDKNAVGPGGEKLGDPKEIVKRAKGYDIDTAKKIRAGLDDAPEHSPAGLQKRVLDRKLKGVAEGISIVDQDSDLDQQVFTLNVDGNKISFTYWDYENNFQNPNIKDIYQQAQEQLGRKLSPEQIKDVARAVFKSFDQGVAEGMPASVIQAKEKIRMASDEENKKRFAGKTKDKLAQMARRHGYGDKNPYAKFHDGVTEEQVNEMSAGSVATVVNPTPKNKAKVGSLFGGTYKQKSTK